MRCRELETCWEDWLEGRGSPELVDHLRTCPRCRVLAEEIRALPPLLASLRREPPTLETAFWVRLRERLELATQRHEAFWAGFNLLAERAATILAVMLLGLLLLTLRQPRPESITGAELAQDTPIVAEDHLTGDQVLLSLAETEPPR